MAQPWNLVDELPTRPECEVDDDLFDFHNSPRLDTSDLPPLAENEEDVLGDRGVILKRLSVPTDGGSCSSATEQENGVKKQPSEAQPYVELHYEGFIAGTGEKFDSSREQGYPLIACLDFAGGTTNLIRGIDAALRTMYTGDRAELFIKSKYAYGESGCTDVPPDTDLRFEVEIIDVRATHKRVAVVDNTKTDLKRLEEVRKQREIASARRQEEEAIRNAAKCQKEDRLKQLHEKLANKNKKKGKKGKKK